MGAEKSVLTLVCSEDTKKKSSTNGRDIRFERNTISMGSSPLPDVMDFPKVIWYRQQLGLRQVTVSIYTCMMRVSIFGNRTAVPGRP